MRTSRFAAAGLFFAVAVLVVEAQPPRPGGFGQQNISTLVVANKALQEELKITDAQKEKFKALAEKQADQIKKGFEGFKEAAGDMDKLKEIFEKNKKAGEKLNDEIVKVVDETLTEDQRNRLKQIDRQRSGVGGFLKEEVSKELDLTESQKGKIKTVVDEYLKDVQEVMKNSGTSFKDGKFTFDKDKFEESQAKRKKLTKAAMGDIDDILTDDQRKKWKDLTGAAFDTSKLLQFGPAVTPKAKEKTKD